MSFADIFDLVMVLIVLFFAVKGVLSGFSGELFSLIGIVGGVYLGLTRSDPVYAALRGWFPTLGPSLCHIAAIAVVFFAFCIVCALIGKAFKALLSFAALSLLDRGCGFLLGFVKGAAVVVIIVVLLSRVQNVLPFDMNASRVVTLVNSQLPAIERQLDALMSR